MPSTARANRLERLLDAAAPRAALHWARSVLAWARGGKAPDHNAYAGWIANAEAAHPPRTAPDLESLGYRLWVEPGGTPSSRVLAALGAAIERQPGADLFYCDEDRLDSEGRRADPFFKPGWSPLLLESCNYLGGVLALRKDLTGDPSREPAAHIARRAARVVHVPEIGYHRAGPRPADPDPPALRVAGEFPSAEVLIPTRKPELLRTCAESVRANTGYPNYRITVLDNSTGAGVREYCDASGLDRLDFRGHPFNFSRLHNLAVRAVSEPLLLFLNDDVTARDPDWLEALVALAQRPEAGAVGARLLYPDGTIQHAGVAIGIFGVCGHVYRGARPESVLLAGYTREVSAVTGACLMTPRARFEEVGGFDEERFPVAYQDIDYCLKLRRAGYSVWCTPRSTLTHHEAASKRPADHIPMRAEVRAFQQRWADVIAHDPYYNPNLTREDESGTVDWRRGRDSNPW